VALFNFHDWMCSNLSIDLQCHYRFSGLQC
jgi:hypothetical protein